LSKTRIVSFFFFLAVQLVLTANISNVAYSVGDPTASSFVETGEASWYGPGFHGRRTASGERFDTHDFTAAHKTLPFGTLLKVTNLENNRFTVVRVNDRGPYVRGRIIDLSRAAKEDLGMGGTALVRIEQITEDEAEMLRNGIDPDEKIDLSQIDTSEFNTVELLDKKVDAESKIFVEFDSEDSVAQDFELNKNLRSSGNLKIKIITPKSDDENTNTDLYQKIDDIDSLIKFYDLTNRLTVVRGYSIEVGTFTDKSLADRRIGRLEGDGFKIIYLEEISVKNPDEKNQTSTYKVLIGLYDAKKYTKFDFNKLKKLKYEPKVIKIADNI
jgi:rare lipoprotein A (peptidoglycan hydrolase)